MMWFELAEKFERDVCFVLGAKGESFFLLLGVCWDKRRSGRTSSEREAQLKLFFSFAAALLLEIFREEEQISILKHTIHRRIEAWRFLATPEFMWFVSPP